MTAATGRAQVEITAYGLLQPDPPKGDAITVDPTTALLDPPVRQQMLHSNGFDPHVLDYILATPGARALPATVVLPQP